MARYFAESHYEYYERVYGHARQPQEEPRESPADSEAGSDGEEYLSPLLIAAVIKNSVQKLRRLVKTKRYDLKDQECGNTLLHIAVRMEKSKAFKYLLKLPKIPLNEYNKEGRTPLIVASQCSKDSFGLALVERGADIHLPDLDGNTPLHCAISKFFMDLSKAIVEKGAKLDRQNRLGETALYLACKNRTVAGVSLLLYHNADPSIPTYSGNTPFGKSVMNNDTLIQENLFYYIFDEDRVTVNLRTLIYAMKLESPFLHRIVGKVGEIQFDTSDLKLLYLTLPIVRRDCLKLFVRKFGYVFQRAPDQPEFLSFFFSHAKKSTFQTNFLENFYILFESAVAGDLVARANTRGGVVRDIVAAFAEHKISRNHLTKLIFTMIACGLQLNSDDINMVYVKYGYCELFKLLLHTDIRLSHTAVVYLMPAVIYDVNLTIERALKSHGCHSLSSLSRLLDYYALPKLKRFCSAFNNERLDAKLAKLPKVPKLLELSRDAARVFIRKRYEVKNSRQFYTVLAKLPICKLHAEIIAFQKRLY